MAEKCFEEIFNPFELLLDKLEVAVSLPSLTRSGHKYVTIDNSEILFILSLFERCASLESQVNDLSLDYQILRDRLDFIVNKYNLPENFLVKDVPFPEVED